MKYECPTYLNSIGKSKTLTATLSDNEPEDDSDNKDDKILNAFIATCKVEFYQPSCWLYSMPNFFVF